MAENNNNIEETSRLLENSADFRTCSIAKNSRLYTTGDEYCDGTSYTIADGDCRGRNPEDGDQNNPSIGIPKDIQMRQCLTAKNSYNCGCVYSRGSNDTIADGDDRGRDPDDGNFDNQGIGIPIDIKMRNCLLAKNSYSRTDSYCPSTSYTIADGDNRGRNPEDGDQNSPTIGIPIDISCRTFLAARNLYNRNNEYTAGSDNV